MARLNECLWQPSHSKRNWTVSDNQTYRIESTVKRRKQGVQNPDALASRFQTATIERLIFGIKLDHFTYIKILIQWNAEIWTPEYQKAPKSECQLDWNSDMFIAILTELMAFVFGYSYGPIQIWLFCVRNLDNCPNSEGAGIGTEATCPKTELVRYLDVHCNDNGLS